MLKLLLVTSPNTFSNMQVNILVRRVDEADSPTSQARVEGSAGWTVVVQAQVESIALLARDPKRCSVRCHRTQFANDCTQEQST